MNKINKQVGLATSPPHRKNIFIGFKSFLRLFYFTVQIGLLPVKMNILWFEATSWEERVKKKRTLLFPIV